MKLIKKLKNKKGESLMEILCAVLVTAIAASLLITMLHISSSLISKAQAKDKQMYEALSLAEVQSNVVSDFDDKKITVNVTQDKTNVTVKSEYVIGNDVGEASLYGKKGVLLSFGINEEGTP